MKQTCPKCNGNDVNAGVHIPDTGKTGLGCTDCGYMDTYSGWLE